MTVKIRIEQDGNYKPSIKVFIDDSPAVSVNAKGNAAACGVEPRITVTKDGQRGELRTLEFEIAD